MAHLVFGAVAGRDTLNSERQKTPLLQRLWQANMQIVDANYVRRYLLEDDKKQSALAQEVISGGLVFLLPETLFEAVNTMGGSYGVPRTELARVLTTFLDDSGIRSKHAQVSKKKALEVFVKMKNDFADCMLAAFCCYLSVDKIHALDKKCSGCCWRLRHRVRQGPVAPYACLTLSHLPRHSGDDQGLRHVGGNRQPGMLDLDDEARAR
jgi:predicted nucleic-acid-binding protein